MNNLIEKLREEVKAARVFDESAYVIDLSQDASASDFARELIDKTMDIPPLSITSPSKAM